MYELKKSISNNFFYIFSSLLESMLIFGLGDQFYSFPCHTLTQFDFGEQLDPCVVISTVMFCIHNINNMLVFSFYSEYSIVASYCIFPNSLNKSFSVCFLFPRTVPIITFVL